MAGADGLPVHCTPALADVLRSNEPSRSLVERGHVGLHDFEDGDSVVVGDSYLAARAVEHRDELGVGTLSLRVEGPARALSYVPDVDRLTEGVRETVRAADVALVDGTFWPPDEVAGYDTVPHPTGREIVDVFDGVDTDVYLNHINPLWDADSAERDRLREASLSVAERGQVFELR